MTELKTGDEVELLVCLGELPSQHEHLARNRKGVVVRDQGHIRALVRFQDGEHSITVTALRKLE